jgi:guanylate kinase
MKKPILFIISAPSGSGKTTLSNMLRQSLPGLLFSVSYTTRPRRTSEENGREYNFVTHAEFENMAIRGEFLEHADVYGNFYGTARRYVDEAARTGQDLLLDIDVQGEEQIKKKVPDAVSIFILPPSKEMLEKRLRDRRDSYAEKIKTDDSIQRRLSAAAREIEKYPNYSYILVNDDLDTCVEQLKAIVLVERAKRAGTEPDPKLTEIAESCRQANVRQRIRPIVQSFALSAAPGGR